MNLKNKLDKKKRLNFVKFEGKYNIFKKSMENAKGDIWGSRIYQNMKKNLKYVGFNLKFKSQLHVSKVLKPINCLLNNFYNFNQLKETYNLNNKDKINLKTPVFFISKRAYNKATYTERANFYSGRHLKKKIIGNTSKKIFFNYKKDNKWNFLKKILIKSVKIVALALFTIVLISLFFYSIRIFEKTSSLNFKELDYLAKVVFSTFFTGDMEELQYYIISNALTDMKYNKYYFYIYPDSEAVLQFKMKYQEQLKTLANKLNYHDFKNPDHGFKFLTVFYEHSLKIIEWNDASVKNININEQFYNNYNKVCIILNKMRPFFTLLGELSQALVCVHFLFKVIKRIFLNKKH